MPTITGTEAGDSLAGTAGNDTISALGGNDNISLSAGHDTVDGGAGDDRLFGSSMGLPAGTHRYTITASTMSDASGALNTTFTSVETISLSDSSGYDVTLDATGFAGTALTLGVALGNHTLTGSGTTDSFLVNGGNAVVDGAAGTDRLRIGAQSSQDAPLIITRSGGVAHFDVAGLQSISADNVESYFVFAAAGNALLADASQFDRSLEFSGSGYADSVVGSTAGDTFSAFGLGDVLAGGAGADSYTFDFGTFTAATILDLEAEDSVSFSLLTGPGGFIGNGAFTGVQGEYRYFAREGQTLIVADTDGDGFGDSALTIANGSFVLAETAPGSNTLHIAGVAPPLDPAPNVIVGTTNADAIGGGSGNDTIDGLGGNDILDGGSDDDTISGGEGNDQLYGGGGDDTIDGGNGADRIAGEDGNDTLTGTDGDGDTLSGGDGADAIALSGGHFTAFGGNGDDHIMLVEGSLNSWLNGDDGDDVITASGTGEINVQGGAGDDDITLTGFSSGNVYLDAGNDVLHLAAGSFTVFLGGVSGQGQDTIVVTTTDTDYVNLLNFAAGEHGDRLDLSIYGADPFGDGTLVMHDNGTNTIIVHTATDATYLLQNVRGADLSAWNLGVPNPGYSPQNMTLDDMFAGSPQFDWSGELIGADGNDTIRGFGGDDALYGSGGNDRLEGGNHNDRLDGGSGDDTLNGDAGTDVLAGGAGRDRLDGGNGTDTADYAAAVAGVTVRLDRLAAQNTGGAGIDTLANIESLTGSAFADKLIGNALTNVLQGGDGNDVLNGLAGNDTMRGGAGDDLYYVDATGDKVIEAGNAGWDAVRASVDHTLATNVEELFIAGAARNGTGNALANTLHGSASANTLAGLAGDDILRGGNGRDVLLGGEGADLLDGGVGKDTLTGGAGREVFQFRDGDFGATRALADTITDFSQADKEKISLNLVDADTTLAGNQAFAWIGNGAFTGVAGQLHYAQQGGNTYVEGDVNGDGTADFVIALTGLVNLVASDFVL